MINRGPGFLDIVWFGSSPTTFPSLPSVSLIGDTQDGRDEEEPNIYKSLMRKCRVFHLPMWWEAAGAAWYSGERQVGRCGGRRGRPPPPPPVQETGTSALQPCCSLWKGEIMSRTKYLHIQSTTVYVPSSELGLPQPLSRKRLSLPPHQRVGAAHSPASVGVWEPQFRRLGLEKKLSTLPTLWCYVTAGLGPLVGIIKSLYFNALIFWEKVI